MSSDIFYPTQIKSIIKIIRDLKLSDDAIAKNLK